MKYIVYTIALIILVAAIASCSKAKQNGNEENAQSSKSQVSKNANVARSPEMADFPEAIFNDIKERFKQEGITLISLKRNIEGQSNLVVATISETPAETYIPKALVTIAQNFSSLDSVKVILGKDGKGYSISAKKLNEIIDKCEQNGDDVDSTLWSAISSPLSDEKKKDKKVQSAGV